MDRIIHNGDIIANNWVTLKIDDDNAAFQPEAGTNLLIPLSSWQSHKEQLLAHQGKLGLLIEGHAELEDFIDDLDKVALIAINFEKFVDGRGYSLARLIRMRSSFQGELRAVGNILRDQLFYLHRCGFQSFALEEDQDIEKALQAFNDFSITYQSDALEPRPIYKR